MPTEIAARAARTHDLPAKRPSPPAPGAVLVLETAGRQEAGASLVLLPLPAGGLIESGLTELHPFSTLGVLFADTLVTEGGWRVS